MPQLAGDGRKVARYGRQSLDKKDSISIEAQLNLCLAECDGAEPVDYIDRGYSGKNLSRPAFQQLMQDVQDGKIRKIICYRLDRISRSILDFGNVWETLSRHNVEFVSVSEKFDTSTPVGRAMLYIIMVFAQLERETIAERVKDNYYQRVKHGGWPGGPAPYGFTIRKADGRNPASLMPTDTLAIVPHIFELYAHPGASLGSVAKQLSRDGVPCARRATWDTVSLHRLLRAPAYVRADATVYAYYKARGLIMANDIEAFDGVHGAIIVGKRTANERKHTDLSEHLLALSSHEGIVPADLFLICQHKLDGNRQIKNTGKGKYTWLSGLLKCGECGYSLKVLNDAKTHRLYLICSGRTNYSVCTHRHSERLEDVEAFVLQSMAKRMSAINNAAKRKNISVDSELAALKAALATCDDKIGNLVSRMADASDVSMRYINAELLRLDEERQAILQKISAVSTPAIPLSFVYVVPDALTFDGKKQLAHTLISHISVTANDIKITWKI